MRYAMLPAALLAYAAFFAPASAGAYEYRLGDIAIGRPWTRAVGARAPTAAAYMSLTNQGAEPDRLISARTPWAQRTELHEMALADGIMRMRPLPDGVMLLPDATVTLAPGGTHLMLVGPSGAFEEGARIPLTLQFERAGEVAVELEVAGPGARGPAPSKRH